MTKRTAEMILKKKGSTPPPHQPVSIEGEVLLPSMPRTTVTRKRRGGQPPSYHLSGTPVKNFLTDQRDKKILLKKRKNLFGDRCLSLHPMNPIQSLAAQRRLHVSVSE